jgi:hypothetical protein
MTPQPSKRVIVVVEGGIADWVMKPDDVEVDIFDFDGLGWLSRDERDQLMSELESGNDELATLALHLTEVHFWEDSETELSALPALHAELHEQTDCEHEHEGSRADS